MPHGIHAYFESLERHRRRVAAFGAVVLVGAALLEWLGTQPRASAALNDPRRFGFEGEETLVRRILLETVGPLDQPGSNAPIVVPFELRHGGEHGAAGEAAERTGTRPRPLRGGSGEGPDALDLRMRLKALALQGPVIRSEDLVVERLVNPEYPDEARDLDIEGVVEMVARVDTTGAVTEVHIVGGTHQPALERSASAAVLQCRYRPYRREAGAEAVWAYYRIAFKLY